ncbi:MAG: hypothetical protein QM528_02100 [Phycisphaerales bacterium]|nr:hypothetical protein [Phycisphaerales bacterium]
MKSYKKKWNFVKKLMEEKYFFSFLQMMLNIVPDFGITKIDKIERDIVAKAIHACLLKKLLMLYKR